MTLAFGKKMMGAIKTKKTAIAASTMRREIKSSMTCGREKMINSAVLVGRLTKDIEIRQTTSGSKTTSFTLAVNRTSKKEGQPDADFISCVAWNKTAELMAQYLHKGSLIGVEGRIQTRSYDNQQGQKVYVTEVVANSVQFLDSRSSNFEQNSTNQINTRSTYQSPKFAPKNQQERHQTYKSYSQPKFSYASGNIDYGAEMDIQSDDLPF